MKTLRKFMKNNKGATAIEYGLIAALIAVAGVSAFELLGSEIASTMDNSREAMEGA